MARKMNAETRARISAAMKARWASKTEEERKAQGVILNRDPMKKINSIIAAKYREAERRRDEKIARMQAQQAEILRRSEQKIIDIFEVREEANAFSSAMEKKLRKRDGYGGWRHLPLDYLAKKLQAELNELLISLKYESPEEVMSECVDVANFVMFIWDIMRSQPDKRVGIVRRGSKESTHGR